MASLIAIGTSKGLVLIFDNHQVLKATIGVGTKAAESGPVTSVALSADVSSVASGHANGNILTWDIAKPARPFLQILSADNSQLQAVKVDAHVIDCAVLHLGFLGTRHTALVSADEKGMAFSHLASRGLGAIARTVKTSRILGRYPEPGLAPARPRKPSSVLAFASLPLGNLESITDSLGLVAMLTPYLLVVVSTTPVAQTQHKAARSKELAAHGAMTAALAWYPAMKAKNISFRAKLAYCWLNIVTILELEEVRPEEGAEKDNPVDLRFTFYRKWQADESIVALQWLNRSVLAMLTVSQQLIILEDESLSVIDSSDLIKKHVYHVDLFSQQLGQMIENPDEENMAMHGVVADAFFMSFKAYKGRLFLLGFKDVSVGTLSNWADRLLALMEQGDFIGAIQIATSYYAGGPGNAALGLPINETGRHDLVRGKLVEMMAASLRYAFGRKPNADTARVSSSQLEHLAQACFVACQKLEDLDFLFEEVYAWYSDHGFQTLFFLILASYVSTGEIQTIPPSVLKDLVNDFIERGHSARLEEILCLLNPATMDLDQVHTLCKDFQLYDALFYIWSQAVGDYVTALRDLLDLSSVNTGTITPRQTEYGHTSKIFTYLSYTLTGRVYPAGNALPDDTALKAKADVYSFLFSGSVGETESPDPFQYLRILLGLDTSSFMSMLNEAFEDSFLDEASEAVQDQKGLTEDQKFGVSLTRQFVIRILLDILVPPGYEPEDIIYLDMFIARNQPKYPQYIRLPGSVLERVLLELCEYPSKDIADDCQLSLEYLLSIYQPPDLSALLPALRNARFFRVIKSIYKSEKQYAACLRTCFDDEENPDDTFDCIEECFNPQSGLGADQIESVRQVIAENITKLLYTDLRRVAHVLNKNMLDLHSVVIENLKSDEHSQYLYLREILEGHDEETVATTIQTLQQEFVELYIRRLCDYDPHHVTEYIDHLDSGHLRLEEVLPAMENSGVIDAAVTLLAREGRVRDAMDRLLQHLKYLEVALLSVLEGAHFAPDGANVAVNAEDMVQSIEQYSKIGIWLCQNQTRAQARAISQKATVAKRLNRRTTQSPEVELLGHEVMWLDLVDSIVWIGRASADSIERPSGDNQTAEDNAEGDGRLHNMTFVLRRLRTAIQDSFTALLAATSIHASAGETDSNPAFLRILRAFLGRISDSSHSVAQLRSVLGAVFSAYAYEENLLSLANRLLEKDLFARFDEASERRRHGWRPSGQTCSSCGLRVWGPGLGAGAWEAWYEKQSSRHLNVLQEANSTESSSPDNGKGKAKAGDNADRSLQLKNEQQHLSSTDVGPYEATQDSLIIFSCRHSYHRRCLERIFAKTGRETRSMNDITEGFPNSMLTDLKAHGCPLEQSSVTTNFAVQDN